MIRIPGGGFVFTVQGTEIEGDAKDGVDVQYPWEDSPRRFHEHEMTWPPSTSTSFPSPTLSSSSSSMPRTTRRATRSTFCATGRTEPSPRAGTTAPSPGSRLKMHAPTQSGPASACLTSGSGNWPRKAPTAAIIRGATRGIPRPFPCPQTGRAMPGPDPVDAHPQGASPYGVMDMVGNVWQWTDEFTDEHTRAAILRGGEYYQPQGSIWYFPQAFRNDQHSKLLLMAPGYDRSGGVGFRCVRDAQ